MVHFFWQSPKNEPHFPLGRAKRAREPSSLDFMCGLKKSVRIYTFIEK
ncbi:MAG: hypothetical protein U5L45_23735 [Saprospiraceae bacterium]|nr:hypothetical protein [Saprospiraceae bacterium]